MNLNNDYKLLTNQNPYSFPQTHSHNLQSNQAINDKTHNSFKENIKPYPSSSYIQKRKGKIVKTMRQIGKIEY